LAAGDGGMTVSSTASTLILYAGGGSYSRCRSRLWYL